MGGYVQQFIRLGPYLVDRDIALLFVGCLTTVAGFGVGVLLGSLFPRRHGGASVHPSANPGGDGRREYPPLISRFQIAFAELDLLQRQRALLYDKGEMLRREYSLSVDPTHRLRLDTNLRELQLELHQVERRIGELTRALQEAQNSRHLKA